MEVEVSSRREKRGLLVLQIGRKQDASQAVARHLSTFPPAEEVGSQNETWAFH